MLDKVTIGQMIARGTRSLLMQTKLRARQKWQVKKAKKVTMQAERRSRGPDDVQMKRGVDYDSADCDGGDEQHEINQPEREGERKLVPGRQVSNLDEQTAS